MYPIRILSFDIGIKNMAYCILEKQTEKSMLNHHLSVLLGLGSLSWAGHQIHIGNQIGRAHV